MSTIEGLTAFYLFHTLLLHMCCRSDGFRLGQQWRTETDSHSLSGQSRYREVAQYLAHNVILMCFFFFSNSNVDIDVLQVVTILLLRYLIYWLIDFQPISNPYLLLPLSKNMFAMGLWSGWNKDQTGLCLDCQLAWHSFRTPLQSHGGNWTVDFSLDSFSQWQL